MIGHRLRMALRGRHRILTLLIGGAALCAPAVASAQTYPPDATWVPLMRTDPMTGMTAPLTDPEGDVADPRDMVGTPALPVAFVYSDATHYYFRLRMDESTLANATNFRPFGWGCVLDTDLDATDYEYSVLVDGVSNPDEVRLWANTVQQTANDPGDNPETLLKGYIDPLTMGAPDFGYAREVSAGTNFPPAPQTPTPDFFLDWSVERSVLQAAGINLQTPLRIACATAANGTFLSVDFTGPANLPDLLSDPVVCDQNGCIPQNCAGFGMPCSAGVGACAATGTVVCDAMGQAVCNAVAGMPSVELCDNVDNDCNGTVDDGNPGSGASCSSGLPGVCGAGTTSCVAGAIMCNADVTPGSQMEMCGDALDSDCDGNPDNGCVIGDSDGDGLGDEAEAQLGTDPNDADSDDDGIPDGAEPQPGADTDGDGLINALDPDSDDDGLFDGTEVGLDCSNPATDPAAGHCIADGDQGATTTDPLDADTDDGGVPDGSEDIDRDGFIDEGETNPTAGNGGDDSQSADSDGDGLSDDFETQIGTDPNDADSDDDGVRDGDEPNPTLDSDGDGVINPLDPDSDNDGLFDGTEMGKDCSDPATDTTAGHCKADADSGTTMTSPVDPDTDDGGVNDGSEDKDLDGMVDPGESDPTTGHGGDDTQNPDADGDGLSDDVEGTLGSDPNDADSDDDGVPDGQEPNPSDDTDGDGLINVLDPDSDGDGLKDGTEMGFDCSSMATDPAAGNCVPDGDLGTTKTSPLDPDTDDGGASDGAEDENKNGVLDAGETDPTTGHGGDDGVDSDGDGVPDDVEMTNGTDPMDGDTDDDGVPDGQEPSVNADTDGDGLTNGNDPDSDGDGIFDGTEMGFDCSAPGTDPAAGNCTPDADMGTTKTDPLNPDTDGGGISDGDEDTNHDGAVDTGELDPLDPSDDQVPCTKDSECGDLDSGKICGEDGKCTDGCRGLQGNACPEGQTCSSETSEAGVCSDVPDGVILEGSGIFCSTGRSDDGGRSALFVLAAISAFAVRRKRR